MSYEVDIRAVGPESKSGDAIALRYGDFIASPGSQTVVVIDGGFEDSGKDLVSHLRHFYETDYIDLVVATHSDADHVSGLQIVLEEMDVGELWMHLPWEHGTTVRSLVDSKFTAKGFSDKLKRSLQGAFDLEKLARKKGIPIVEPFSGVSSADGVLQVIGPSEEYYEELVAEFVEGEELTGTAAASGVSLLSAVGTAVRKALKWVTETWDKDELVEPEPYATSPQNRSSVILLAELGQTFLLTGDAGVLSLELAADYAEVLGIDLASTVNRVQVPHHGSKRNVGPEILNRIVGPIVVEGESTGKYAFVSAAKKGEPKHPSRRVTNAFTRRGSSVSATQGQSHFFRSDDVPMRPNWVPITPVPFTPEYEEEED